MITRIDLSGRWDFCLDKDKNGVTQEFYKKKLEDTINLPTTVSEAKKGIPSDFVNTYFLTDPYLFEGYTWYSRNISLGKTDGKEFFLVLERTRVSHVWVDDRYAGSENSLCTSHRYRLTPLISKKEHRLTVMVDNTSYPVGGGHMTSKDTQTNWNGITGDICLEVYPSEYLTDIHVYPDVAKKQIKVQADWNGSGEVIAKASVTDMDGISCEPQELKLTPGRNEFIYGLDDGVKLWSEYTPVLYSLMIEIPAEGGENDTYSVTFGLRDFKAAGRYFEINGRRTFLRGKHDGLIFPLTGYAPTDTDSWMKVFTTAKSYGINHYRFHTCCPPEAAFRAADRLGVYLEPELPFWGTVTEEGEENHDEKAQQYLIREGFRILQEFGNHPSFVMMSMGNELWGSKKVLNELLGRYKQYDNRHLYTQGSNNYQFVPCILENEDFFCGVRFSRDRLFRGSYAMCDAPQGHIQTAAPNSNHSYDPLIRPEHASGNTAEGGSLMIQYGTGMKRVSAEDTDELIPHIPVVSHEIGQYEMYPDYREIEKYTGVLKPRNLETFRERLAKAGMLPQAERFFEASGKLSSQCYKAEIETALRSSELAGFQLLDLQDFTGQGTALVGILNAFMENKGVISAREWREFCSDSVLLAELSGFVFRSGESIKAGILLSHYAPRPIINPRIIFRLAGDGDKQAVMKEETAFMECTCGVYRLGEFILDLPHVDKPKKITLQIMIEGTQISNRYDLWIYPEVPSKIHDGIVITESMDEAMQELEAGKNVLFFPNNLNGENSIEGTYCTDFWCYPMFRSISESMNKPVPIGTLGLLIDKNHPAFVDYPTEFYTTPQWYDIVSASRSVILNNTRIEPLVWTIDNFERNHRLGLLFELQAGAGRLLVCGADLRKLQGSLPAGWLLYSLLRYMESEKFKPQLRLELEEVEKIFTTVR